MPDINGQVPYEAPSLKEFERFLGSSTVNHYEGLENAPLVIGKDRFSFRDISRRTGLPAGKTSRLISKIAADHGATSIKDLYKKSSPSSVAVHQFGSCSLGILFLLFRSEGLSVEAWANRGEHWKGNNFSTFMTYKKRELAAEKRTTDTAPAGPRETGYRKKAVQEERRQEKRLAKAG